VDSEDVNNQTPLMWAAMWGNVEMCAMLLEHGARLEARDSLGATPLLFTVQHAQHLTFL
jgi:ankyrin repeat protein